MVATFWLAMIVSIPVPLAWAFTAFLLATLMACLVSYGRVRIEVTSAWICVGRATLETNYVGEVEELDRAQMRDISGPAADARAFLMLRPYLDRGVKIQLADPADPTPYWLISSRRPSALAAAIRAGNRTPATRS